MPWGSLRRPPKRMPGTRDLKYKQGLRNSKDEGNEQPREGKKPVQWNKVRRVMVHMRSCHTASALYMDMIVITTIIYYYYY